MNERLVIFAGSAVTAIALIALGLPLAGRRIPPNWIYGFRLPSLVKDPSLWYPANVYAGRWAIALGLATLVAAFVGYFLPLRTETYGVVVACTVGGGAIAMLEACVLWLGRRLRARKNEAARKGA